MVIIIKQMGLLQLDCLHWIGLLNNLRLQTTDYVGKNSSLLSNPNSLKLLSQSALLVELQQIGLTFLRSFSGEFPYPLIKHGNGQFTTYSLFSHCDLIFFHGPCREPCLTNVSPCFTLVQHCSPECSSLYQHHRIIKILWMEEILHHHKDG